MKKQIVDNRLNQEQARFLRKRADVASSMLGSMEKAKEPKEVQAARKAQQRAYKLERQEEARINKKYERIRERYEAVITRWKNKIQQEAATRRHRVNQRRQEVEKSILFGTADEALKAVEKLEADAAKVK